MDVTQVNPLKYLNVTLLHTVSLIRAKRRRQSEDKVSLFLKAPFPLMLTVITEGYPLNGAAMIIDI